jgi:4-amino-4-deoxy-L-arabinose transferase-like glycosyltransferase
MPERKVFLTNCWIAIAGTVLFIPLLGGVHLFDWDEINFAESAREMIVTGDYLTVRINFVPFWEKPPLFIWMQVLSMQVFGINEFAARFPNAICGLVSLLVLYNLGRKLIDHRFGLLWVFFFGGSLLPFFYFKSGIIDPWFNLFIFLGIYQMYQYCSGKGNPLPYAIYSAFFMGLAVLTKGPVALLVLSLTTLMFLTLKKFRVKIRIVDVLVYILVLAFTGGFWFLLQILKGNFTIIADFIFYQIRLFRTQDAGHGGFLLYHFVVLLVGVFPASLFALPVLFRTDSPRGAKKDFYYWMLILFWVVLILFTVVRTKIVHYSSLCYFPLTFLAAWSFYHGRSYLQRWKILTPVMVSILGVLLAMIMSTLTLVDHYKDIIIHRNWIDDPFATACLKADAAWKGFEWVTGLVLLTALTAFLISWRRKRYDLSLQWLTGTFTAFLLLAMILIAPPVEAYSQRAAVDFFKSVGDQDAYLETVGYKSYTHLFYGRAKNHTHPQARDEKWILEGTIDKPAYIAIKINHKEKFMEDYPDVRLIYEKNGFAFFSRTPNQIK